MEPLPYLIILICALYLALFVVNKRLCQVQGGARDYQRHFYDLLSTLSSHAALPDQLKRLLHYIDQRLEDPRFIKSLVWAELKGWCKNDSDENVTAKALVMQIDRLEPSIKRDFVLAYYSGVMAASFLTPWGIIYRRLIFDVRHLKDANRAHIDVSSQHTLLTIPHGLSVAKAAHTSHRV